MKAITPYISLLLCAGSLTVGFQYQDNQIAFDMVGNSTFSLNRVSFSWTDSSITPGQDPQGVFPSEWGPDTETSGESDGASWLYYIAGRHASSTVSNWWQRHFADSETTFNHHPGSLNFGLFGTLQLYFDGCTLADKPGYCDVPVTIPNVGLAQGHDGNGNNWWFGVQGAQHSGGYSGSDAAILVDAAGYQFEFFRGSTYKYKSESAAGWGNIVDGSSDENPICTNAINEVRIRVLGPQ